MTEKIKKINEQTLEQLRSRLNALNSVKVLIQMAQREYNLYFIEVLKSMGIEDVNKYTISLKNGEIKEKKEEEVKIETVKGKTI